MTTEESGSETSARARRWWIIAAAAAVVIILVLVIGMATGWGRGSSTSSGGPSASSVPGDSDHSSPSPSTTTGADPDGDTPATVAPRETSAPVPLDQVAEPASGVRVSLASITAISGQASVPGEVAGPALQVTVNVENANDSDALTDTLIVNVYYGTDRTPANILVQPRQDLPLSIAPGEAAQGVYAFTVPEAARGQILVEVDLSVDLPVVLFEGPVS
ncbi:hypothetical protein ACI3KT_17140 [Microbacterium sp. ZW T6_19]|uniref:hypothetical protein n=1 Tax=Microbacterium sp. ZW T6_19 TaxID=3378082 RepID=UPI003853F892